jgi:raffinose/stachyose/melibiose transport system substrate-binding protein
MDITQAIGDSLVKDYPGTKITWTFANSAAQAANALRWQNGDPIDVDTNKFTYWAQDTWAFVDNDLLLVLTPSLQDTVASGEKWADTFYPLVLQFSQDQREGPTKGKYFSVPESTTLMLIHYNKKAFDQMGVQPAKTWPEFLTLCDTIKEKGASTGMKPICVSGPTAPYVAHWWDRLTQRYVGTQAVMDYLAEVGNVPLRRIGTSHGFGELQAVADNSTREGREQNRRVEIKLLVSRGINQNVEVKQTTDQQ